MTPLVNPSLRDGGRLPPPEGTPGRVSLAALLACTLMVHACGGSPSCDDLGAVCQQCAEPDRANACRSIVSTDDESLCSATQESGIYAELCSLGEGSTGAEAGNGNSCEQLQARCQQCSGEQQQCTQFVADGAQDICRRALEGAQDGACLPFCAQLQVQCQQCSGSDPLQESQSQQCLQVVSDRRQDICLRELDSGRYGACVAGGDLTPRDDPRSRPGSGAVGGTREAGPAGASGAGIDW